MAVAHALGKSLSGPGGIGEMDLDELAMWAAWYAEHDPQLRGDLHAGVIAATVANAALGSKGGWKPEDFMATLKQANKAKSDEEMEKAMIAWCANVGGEVRTESKP
jgi:hypothetical protein